MNHSPPAGRPKFPPISALGVVSIAFVAMSLKAKHIIANPGDILTILAPLAVFYLISYVLRSRGVKSWWKIEDARARGFGVGRWTATTVIPRLTVASFWERTPLTMVAIPTPKRTRLNANAAIHLASVLSDAATSGHTTAATGTEIVQSICRA